MFVVASRAPSFTLTPHSISIGSTSGFTTVRLRWSRVVNVSRDASIRTKIIAYVNGAELRRVDVPVIILPAGNNTLVIGPVAVHDTDPVGDVTGRVEIYDNSDGSVLHSENSPVLARVGSLPPVALTGGFERSLQTGPNATFVRPSGIYIGGIETQSASRSVFIILSAYVSTSPGGLSTSTTPFRQVKSGTFTIPISRVPAIGIPLYSSDPAGFLWFGLKVFDASTESLLVGDYGTERIEGPLWGLNTRWMELTWTGASIWNWVGFVNLGFTYVIKNLGDHAANFGVKIQTTVLPAGPDLPLGFAWGMPYGSVRNYVSGGSLQAAGSDRLYTDANYFKTVRGIFEGWDADTGTKVRSNLLDVPFQESRSL